MKNLFYFVLGLCLVILTSATTASVMTVKPATPKSIVSFYDVRCNGYNVARKIKEYSSKGYIYKHGFGSDCHIVVVMENINYF
jgi:hypothetical protein